MTSQIQELAERVGQLASPSDALRRVLQDSLRAARSGEQTAASAGRGGAAAAECFRRAQHHLQRADHASATFGLDAKAFARALAGGSANRAAFQRKGAAGAASAAKRDFFRKLLRSFLSEEVASQWMPKVFGAVAGQVDPGNDSLGEAVEQAMEAAFAAFETGVPSYFAARLEAVANDVQSHLGKRGM